MKKNIKKTNKLIPSFYDPNIPETYTMIPNDFSGKYHDLFWGKGKQKIFDAVMDLICQAFAVGVIKGREAEKKELNRKHK